MICLNCEITSQLLTKLDENIKTEEKNLVLIKISNKRVCLLKGLNIICNSDNKNTSAQPDLYCYPKKIKTKQNDKSNQRKKSNIPESNFYRTFKMQFEWLAKHSSGTMDF